MADYRMAVMIAPALLLPAGCSGEPSETDIKKAYDTKLSQINSSQPVLKLRLHSLKKLGCSKAQNDPGYNCDVEVDGESSMGRQKNAVKVRLVKSDAGWVLIEEKR